MNIDCHVHICALTPGHGSMSPRILKSLPFRFMRWRLGMVGEDAQTERNLKQLLVHLLDQTAELDAAAILAFDAVYTPDGQFDPINTHFHVTNDYVMDLCRLHPKMLFGASVHPYRKDAIAELERCARAGAVLIKWLPIVQDINPADDRCIPFYEALAHYDIPLLSHTGGEKTLPNINPNVMDPALLLPALQRGVRVIAAHCGTRSAPGEPDYVPTFLRMARDHEHLYGDTAALNLPTRSYAYPSILSDKLVRAKLIHGSDWPILPVPPVTILGLGNSLRALRDRNWLRRDITLKKMLKFDDEYWHRAAKVLRLPHSLALPI
jgi:predicted TIM-barrel fold metal-dependent hydrolase